MAKQRTFMKHGFFVLMVMLILLSHVLTRRMQYVQGSFACTLMTILKTGARVPMKPVVRALTWPFYNKLNTPFFY